MEMEKFRQMAREQGIDLQIQGLACLPRDIRKYTRHIWKRQKKSGVAYVALMKHKDFYLSKTFNTSAEAEQYIRLTNVREGLPIKNWFIVFANRVEVELTGGKTLICNVDNIDLIESHTWNCSSKGYATTHVGTTLQCFHNMVMWHLPSEITVDHINRNGLDNHKSNLRLVDQRIQTINQGVKSTNSSGVTGVSYYKKSKLWVATWQDANGNQGSKSFGSKKYGNDVAKAMAIEHRAQMIWSLPHYREALCLDDPQA